MPAKNPKNPDLRLYYIQREPPIIPLTSVQSYFPSLEVLFSSIQSQSTGSPTLAATDLLLDLSGSVGTVENQITKEVSKVPVWTRIIHLVDPLAVMAGEFILPKDGSLPTFREAWQQTLRKINDPYNEAYTAAVASCMTSRLVEQGISPHFCRFYGTYTGRVAEYRYNITEDLEEIENEPWFHEGIKTGAFKILALDPYNHDIEGPLEPWTPPQNRRVPMDEETIDESDEESEESDDSHSGTLSATSQVSEVGDDDIPIDGEVTLSRPRIRLERATQSTESTSSGDSNVSALDYVAILKDFPVQATFLERCDGTMDDLMEDEVDEDASPDLRETKEERWTAWIFQVVAALTAAQQSFDLIHNDLHTNNVVWSGTAETHLYYHIQGAPGGDRHYRVPTYGRIFKIIDFGRATFRPPHEKAQTWIPDVYSPDADAGGQYNCGPYYDKDKPKVMPNRSFDLCRLSVAMLETLWENQPAVKEPAQKMTAEPGRIQNETVSPLWNLLWLWLTDNEGKNFLRSPNGRERYPEFDLYCAIAESSENAVPAQQLTMPLFDEAFKVRTKDIPSDAIIWKLQGQQKKLAKKKK